jgi:hypothetical protein
MRYFGAAICGIAFSLLLFISTPLFALSELGGPTNWAFPILFAATLALTLTAIISRPRCPVAGVVCGVLFSLPVVFVCHLVRSSDPGVLREHGGQLLFAAYATAAISVLALAAVGASRKTGSQSEQGKPLSKE